jgi:hypothetical protein
LGIRPTEEKTCINLTRERKYTPTGQLIRTLLIDIPLYIRQSNLLGLVVKASDYSRRVPYTPCVLIPTRPTIVVPLLEDHAPRLYLRLWGTYLPRHHALADSGGSLTSEKLLVSAAITVLPSHSDRCR